MADNINNIEGNNNNINNVMENNNNNNDIEGNNNNNNRVVGRARRGRQRVELRRIESDDARQVCFSKRRNGLFTKASELTTLCGAEVVVLVYSPAGRPYSYGSPSVNRVIDRFLTNNQVPTVCPNPTLATSQEEENAYHRGVVQHLNMEYMNLVRQLESIRVQKTEMEERIEEGTRGSQEGGWFDSSRELGLHQLTQLFDSLNQVKARMEVQTNHLRNNQPAINLLPLHAQPLRMFRPFGFNSAIDFGGFNPYMVGFNSNPNPNPNPIPYPYPNPNPNPNPYPHPNPNPNPNPNSNPLPYPYPYPNPNPNQMDPFMPSSSNFNPNQFDRFCPSSSSFNPNQFDQFFLSSNNFNSNQLDRFCPSSNNFNPNQVDPFESNSNNIYPNQVDPFEPSSNNIYPNQVDLFDPSASNFNPNQVDPFDPNLINFNPNQVDPFNPSLINYSSNQPNEFNPSSSELNPNVNP